MVVEEGFLCERSVCQRSELSDRARRSDAEEACEPGRGGCRGSRGSVVRTVGMGAGVPWLLSAVGQEKTKMAKPCFQKRKLQGSQDRPIEKVQNILPVKEEDQNTFSNGQTLFPKRKLLVGNIANHAKFLQVVASGPDSLHYSIGYFFFKKQGPGPY